MQAQQPSGARPERTPEQRIIDLLEAGDANRAQTLFDQVLTQPPSEASKLDRGATIVHRAVAAWRLGRVPLALELAAEGWIDIDATDVRGPRAAQAIGLLGYLMEAIGRQEIGIDMHRRSVAVARDADDPSVLAHCLQRLGGSLNYLAPDLDPEGSDAAFVEARDALFEGTQLQSDGRVNRALRLALARSLVGLGDVDAAEALARVALHDARAVGSLWGTGVGYWVLGGAAARRGDDRTAVDLFSRAVAEIGAIDDASLMQNIAGDLASAGARLGDTETEARALREVIMAGRRTTDTLREGLGQALEQRRVAVQAQRLAVAAQRAAARDPLTGLANRLGLEQAATAVLQAATTRGRTPWLAIVDVDHFKRVNDHSGHATGDAVLREVARLLREQCRADDLVARWAGDEFVLLLAGIDGEQRSDAGPAAAERIRAAVAEHRWPVLLDLERRPTVSIGLARGTGDLDSLFADADAALYRAKRSGRDRVEIGATDNG